jgi:hypothetical protein
MHLLRAQTRFAKYCCQDPETEAQYRFKTALLKAYAREVFANSE